MMKIKNTIGRKKNPNLGKEKPIHIQEADRSPNRQDHVIVKNSNVQNKESILKLAKEKAKLHTKAGP